MGFAAFVFKVRKARGFAARFAQNRAPTDTLPSASHSMERRAPTSPATAAAP